MVLLHGVPASSFLYRKVIPQLADQGLRAIAFDFPGLGLADRPQPFDYSWSGLARWLGEAIDALGLDRCHLVVHDIGGPIGCEWAVRNPDRVLSLTALNTDLTPGRPSAARGRCGRSRSAAIGELWLRADPAARVRRAVSPPGPRRPRGDVAGRDLRLSRAAPAPRSRPCLPADHARLRAHRGEAATARRRPRRPPLPGADHLGRARSRARARPHGQGPAGARRRRPGAAARQALPPGGPVRARSPTRSPTRWRRWASPDIHPCARSAAPPAGASACGRAGS